MIRNKIDSELWRETKQKNKKNIDGKNKHRDLINDTTTTCINLLVLMAIKIEGRGQEQQHNPSHDSQLFKRRESRQLYPVNSFGFHSEFCFLL